MSLGKASCPTGVCTTTRLISHTETSTERFQITLILIPPLGFYHMVSALCLPDNQAIKPAPFIIVQPITYLDRVIYVQVLLVQKLRALSICCNFYSLHSLSFITFSECLKGCVDMRSEFYIHRLFLMSDSRDDSRTR